MYGLPCEISGAVSPTVDESLDMAPGTWQIPAPHVNSLSHERNPQVVLALRHIWNNVAVEQSLKQVINEFQPDLIYERYSPFGVAGGIMARAADIPHFLEVNAPLAWEGKKYRQQAVQDAADVLEEVAFASASNIITVSEVLREDLLSQGISADKVRTVPNGVDTEAFSPHGPTSDVGAKHRFVIGFVGSLRPWHGLETLIEAYRQLADDPGFHLVVVGDGPMASSLRTLAVELPGRVTLTGSVPQFEVPSYLRAMDIAVAPYPPLEKFYFSPLKVLEYMAVGLPVVASGIGQLNQLIQHGETGLLVPPGDANSLVRAIRNISVDEGFRRRLGSNAAEIVRQEHTWKHRAEQILNEKSGGGLGLSQACRVLGATG